jgi:vacuolar-type H+-ATPase subunit C/Vma6
MLTTNVQAGLDSKVNLATTYNMCEITANEDGSLNEDFVNGVLSNTMQVIRNSLDKLFLRKANKNVTDQLQSEKASITYVNELVGSSL